VYVLQEVGLHKLYEHKLERSAANMCYGPFGRTSSDLETSEYDAICVQSLDGQLSIFEQASFAFSRFLGNFVIPGPLCYCRQLDTFFTVNSGFELECYKYQTLTSATLSDNNTNTKKSGSSLSDNSFKHGKKLEANWRYVLGEGCLGIRCSRFAPGLKKSVSRNDVIVLGERTLFVLSSEGECKHQKRLEYPPTSLAVYPAGPGQVGSNIVVATSTGYLMVYDTKRLIWSAKHGAVPVALEILKFRNLDGLIATLDENGGLAVSYLGTDPPTQVVSTSNEVSFKSSLPPKGISPLGFPARVSPRSLAGTRALGTERGV